MELTEIHEKVIIIDTKLDTVIKNQERRNGQVSELYEKSGVNRAAILRIEAICAIQHRILPANGSENSTKVLISSDAEVKLAELRLKEKSEDRIFVLKLIAIIAPISVGGALIATHI
jgi:hypothetical protein